MFTLLKEANFVTLSLVLAFSPIFRNIIAGLSLYNEEFLKENSFYRLVDVTNIGQILKVGLSLTIVRSRDHSILYVPNDKFQRYALIDYSQSIIRTCQIKNSYKNH